MVKISNFYTERDMYYTEVVKTLEDFTYGNKVKCVVPALMPLVEQNKITEKKVRNKVNTNIMNKDTNSIKTKLGDFITCNYIEIFIPIEYAPTYKKTIYDGHMTPHEVVGVKDKGNKNEQFLVSFIGGDINTFRVIGRANK